MQIQDLFIVLLIALMAWGWWADRGIKQMAYRCAKKHCEQAQVQLLDDNISLSSMKIKRGESGRLCLQRTFTFEFTSTGERRYLGRLELQGSKVVKIELAAFHIN